MIRKPPADWNRLNEGAAVRTVRTASAVAKGSVDVARRSGHVVRGLFCFLFAIIWGFAAIASGLARKSAKPHRHRSDGRLHGLGRPPGVRESARDVGLT